MIQREEFLQGKYNFPFEGEKHACTVVELPYRGDVWRDEAVPATKEYIGVIKAIAKFEPIVVAWDRRISKRAFELFSELEKIQNVRLVEARYDDSWARDNLPVFVRSESGKAVAVDFGFNAWGGTFDGLYSSWDDDNALGRTLIEEKLGYSRYPLKDFILEGGSIHTDGKGTLLTTEECLLSKGRNPSLTKDQIENVLKESLGIRKVIWLPYGVYRDETDGHVDNIACFLDSTHVLLGFPDGDRDPQFRRSKADEKVLKESTNADGEPIQVIRIPMPGPLFATAEEAKGLISVNGSKPRRAGDRLAGSYVNFYMGEDFVVIPSFGCPEDLRAKHILEKFFDGKKTVIQVPGREILLGGGNIHCITKQIPLGR